MGGYNACESDVDCPKSAENVAHCCRAFDINSNLACLNVSSCVGRHCEVDTECAGLCCVLNKCTKCPQCLSDDECQTEKLCCGKFQFNQHGQCRSTCLGLPCHVSDECTTSRCCKSGTCVLYGECAVENILIAVVATSLGLCCIFLMVAMVYALYKFKRMLKRRCTVAPANLEMNGTVLTMPTTYPCTNNRTTSSSQT